MQTHSESKNNGFVGYMIHIKIRESHGFYRKYVMKNYI